MAKKRATRKRSGDIRVPTTATNYDVTYKGPPSYRPPRYPKPPIQTNAFIFDPKKPFRHERIGRPTPSPYYRDRPMEDTFSPEKPPTRRTPPRRPVAPPATPETGKPPKMTG